MLAPTVLRTWAPRGETPLLRHWGRHDRISVISGLSVSPERQRLGLYYQWHHHNIRQIEVCGFLSHLLRHLRGPVIVLWDRLWLHRSPAAHDMCRRVPRLRLEYFPAYAPELNPDEQVWSLTKRRLRQIMDKLKRRGVVRSYKFRRNNSYKVDLSALEKC